jgi:hypothetical protein
MPVCLSGRYDPNARASLGINDVQTRPRDVPYNTPARLQRCIALIRSIEGESIIKNARRGYKIDTMFHDIRGGFDVVPLEIFVTHQKCGFP